MESGQPARLAYRAVLFRKNTSHAGADSNLSYSEENRSFGHARCSHSGGLLPTSEALEGAGTGGGRRRNAGQLKPLLAASAVKVEVA